MSTEVEIQKALSRNDVGLTGSHQSGIVLPKNIANSGVFPRLGAVKNPFEILEFVDVERGLRLRLRFVHYNSKFFGGRKDEFQLTGLTSYFRLVGAMPEGVLKLRIFDGKRSISYEMSEVASNVDTEILRLSNEWKIINF
jgi:hypothetical protein